MKRRLEEIKEQLSLSKVEERPLCERNPKIKPIRGYSSGNGTVVVNPIPDILDTLIHELLHERYPKWSERYIKSETTRLVRSLTHEEQTALYKEYQACKTKKKKLTVA